MRPGQAVSTLGWAIAAVLGCVSPEAQPQAMATGPAQAAPAGAELRLQMVPGLWITGEVAEYTVEFTEEVPVAWQALATIQLTNTPYFYVDTTATNSSKRLYRAVMAESPAQAPLTNSVGGAMIWIKPGKFTMGSPASEEGRYDDEGPQTEVTLTKGFWLGKYEVTQGEYEAVMGSNPSTYKGATLPVETVSWQDATNYCVKLTVRERNAGTLPAGYEYRLPTEAQWEYACRAGSMTRFSFGDSDSQLGNYAWYRDNSGSQTHPVGQKQPSAWGLYDMQGNVYEWCADYWGSYPGGSVTDPAGASSGSSRVNRGGGWYYGAWSCRSAYRGRNDPGDRFNDLGFRAVLAPVQ